MMKRGEILALENKLNYLESEIKNLEKSFMLNDLKKFKETKEKILLAQKEIKVLTK